MSLSSLGLIHADNAKCATRNSYQLKLRSDVVGRPRQSAPDNSAAPSGPAPGTAAARQAPSRAAASALSPAVAPPVPARPPAPAPAPAAPVVVPAHVDGDLEGKSDFVKAEVGPSGS